MMKLSFYRLSIFTTFALLLPLICNLIAIFSVSWWSGDFEVLLARGRRNEFEKIPPNYTLHWLFGVRYGLTKVCWWAQQAALSGAPKSYNQIVPNLHHCTSYDSMKEGYMDDVQAVHTCLVIGIVFNVFAFYAAFFDLCCLHGFEIEVRGYSVPKRYPLYAVISTIVIAVLALLVGVSIAASFFDADAAFMQAMRKTVPFLGQEVEDDVQLQSMLARVFKRLDQGLTESDVLREVFGFGFSFSATCVGLMFLLLLLICYFCCFQRSEEEPEIKKDSLLVIRLPSDGIPREIRLLDR